MLLRLWHKETFLALALPALTTTFGLQLLRVLMPSFLWYLGDSVELSYVLLGLLALAVFGASFLAGAFRRRLGHARALIVATSGVGIARLAEQLSINPASDLLYAVVGTILFMFFFPVYLAQMRAEGGDAIRRFGRGFLLGVALDTTIHGALGTLDLSWQTDWVALVFVALLVAAQWALLRRLRAVGAPEDYASAWRDAPLVAIGPFIFVSLVILQNLARVTTLTGFAPPMAFAFLVVANAIGLAAALLPIIPERSTMFAVVVATGFVAILASRPDPQPGTSDLLYLFGNLLLFPLVTLIFAGLSAKSSVGEFTPSVIANGIGWVIFVVLMFAYYISYEMRLPFPNTWLPPFAVMLVGVGAIIAMRTMPLYPAAESWTSATIAFVLVLVPIGMAIGWRTPAPETGNGFPVRVMTYNIHNGFNTDGRLDLESIARTIEQGKPDVVGLQEIARGWVVDSSVDTLAWLSRRLKMPYIFAPTADRVWGNAILSRYPIKAWGSEPLPPRDLPLKRGVMWARIDAGNGDELLFIATHYHHVEKDTAIRQQQSPEIVRVWNQRPRVVMVGDLNARPESKEIAMLREAGLKDAFAAIGNGDGFTFNSVKPYERIDYIWFSPDLKLSDLMIPKSTASDHLGIAVTVGK
ncbi:MAG: endonuclease/exonuclease/phosphatase family protein [Chloroflexi bacterium]|nr:endonuclease/exonuclease/phosphatase family protein [Chloroflexota bacterium]